MSLIKSSIHHDQPKSTHGPIVLNRDHACSMENWNIVDECNFHVNPPTYDIGKPSITYFIWNTTATTTLQCMIGYMKIISVPMHKQEEKGNYFWN